MGVTLFSLLLVFLFLMSMVWCLDTWVSLELSCRPRDLARCAASAGDDTRSWDNQLIRVWSEKCTCCAQQFSLSREQASSFQPRGAVWNCRGSTSHVLNTPELNEKESLMLCAAFGEGVGLFDDWRIPCDQF